MPNSFRTDIEGLRAVAVLAVLLFHFDVPYLQGGFVGVDIFFVISGFLITRLILADINAGTFTFSGFYARRARRILPALLVTLLLTFFAAALFMSPGAFQDTAGSVAAATLSVSNFYFWSSSGYFDAEAEVKPLLHTWSLGVEEQFYLFWPALLVLAVRRWRPVSLVAVTLIASLAGAEYLLSTAPAAAWYLLPFRVYEFAIGASLVGLVKLYPVPRWVAEGGLVAGLAMIGTSIVGFDGETPFPGLAALLPCVGAGLVIYCGGAARWTNTVLTNSPMRWVGRVSYSLYLVHWPVSVFAKYLLLRQLTFSETVIALELCFVLAWLSWKYVEQPFRRPGGYFVGSAKGCLLSASVYGALVIVPVYSAWSSGGWPWRIPGLPEYAKSISDPRLFHGAFYGGRGCDVPRCEIRGPEGSRKLYVIGDSHARSYYAGLKRAFPDFHLVIFGPNSCPLYSRHTGSHRDAHTASCDAARQQAYNEISNKDGDVILIQHWVARMASPHYSDDASAAPLRFRGSTDFARFVAKELRAIQAMIGDRKLIIIGNVPRYDAPLSPLDCIARPFQLASCEAAPLSSEYVSRAASFNAAFKTTRGKIEWLDPFDFLCSNGACRNFTRSGAPIYSDKTHLSGWGAEFLAGQMAGQIREILGIPRARGS